MRLAILYNLREKLGPKINKNDKDIVIVRRKEPF
jgi:hypothetical protein